jgi:hypothetical protein
MFSEINIDAWASVARLKQGFLPTALFIFFIVVTCGSALKLAFLLEANRFILYKHKENKIKLLLIFVL